MSAVVDLDGLSSRDLLELAHLRRDAEEREAERRAALLADMLARPALGRYLRAGVEGAP